LRPIWIGKLWISAGGFTRESAIERAEEQGELIAFGRYYTSNVGSNSSLPSFCFVLKLLFPISPIFQFVFKKTFL